MRPWLPLLLLTGCIETGLSQLEKELTEDTDAAPPPPGDPATPGTSETTPPDDDDTGTLPPIPEEPIADAGPDVAVDALLGATADGTASYDPAGRAIVAWEWTIVSSPPGSTAALSATDTATVDLVTDVDGTWELELTVQNDAGLWDSTPDRMTITAAALPPVADAGLDATYEPLDGVVLDGTASYDPLGHEPLTYAWTVVGVPTNSTAVLDDPTSATPSFLADLAGDYIFELSVTNTLGTADPTPDQVVITVTPADGFYVEVSWPGNADLDLHLANSAAAGIFDCPNDCSFDQPNPNWGGAGPTDDPSLDADTIPGVAGLGPEIITIDVPATDVYEVRVHYYGDNGDASCLNCPDAAATVNIYLGGVLAATYVETLFDDDDVWNVATIDWPSGLITPINTLGSTSRTACY